MRLSAITEILAGAPLPSTPTGDSLDERIAACFFGEPPASRVLKVLIEDVRRANVTATEHLEAAKAKSLDPVTAADQVAEARRMIEDAGWRQARTEIAGKRLSEVLERVQRAEQQAERDKQRSQVIELRDAMAAELRERYPALVNELIGLLSRMQAVDDQARSMGLPTSEDLARHGAVQGNTPPTSLTMCRLVDFERRYDAFAWIDGRSAGRPIEAMRVRGSYAEQADKEQASRPAYMEVPTLSVTVKNTTRGQRLGFTDAFNSIRWVMPGEEVPATILDADKAKFEETLSVTVHGPGKPARRAT